LIPNNLSIGHATLKRVIKSADFLIVDEAAQALEAELCIPFQLNPQNMILIGDPQQLPATIMSQEVR
jgi:superfamily I DNA and/or RNA helicase